MPVTVPGSTGDDFYDMRVRAAAAVPPEQRPQDVTAFLEAVELGNAAAALLPLPSRSARQTDEEDMAVLEAAGRAAIMAPQPQAEQDAEAAAALAYLSISYAALPGQPRPLNHPRFTGEARARVDAVLGGADAALMEFEVTYRFLNPTISAAQRNDELRRSRAAGRDVRLEPDGSMVLTANVLEGQLLPTGEALPRDLRTAVRALLLASTLGASRQMGAGARILRRLGGLFDEPAALAQLGQQLEAAQARRGGAAPRLPSAQQLQQLWLRMCVRGTIVDDEAWPGYQEWRQSAARRLAQLDSDNPRAWLELALERIAVLDPLEAAARARGIRPPCILQRRQELYQVFRCGLDAARAARNRYCTAYTAFDLAVGGLRLQRSCTPAEAAELLREGEAAWAAVKKLLPDDWTTALRLKRAEALAAREMIEAHERESPQAWSAAIFDRLRGRLASRLNSAERRRNEGQQGRPTCAGCGQCALATRLCSGCGKARYCSKECQRAHWREHKPRCLAAQAARASGSGSDAPRGS